MGTSAIPMGGAIASPQQLPTAAPTNNVHASERAWTMVRARGSAAASLSRIVASRPSACVGAVRILRAKNNLAECRRPHKPMRGARDRGARPGVSDAGRSPGALSRSSDATAPARPRAA